MEYSEDFQSLNICFKASTDKQHFHKHVFDCFASVQVLYVATSGVLSVIICNGSLNNNPYNQQI